MFLWCFCRYSIEKKTALRLIKQFQGRGFKITLPLVSLHSFPSFHPFHMLEHCVTIVFDFVKHQALCSTAGFTHFNHGATISLSKYVFKAGVSLWGLFSTSWNDQSHLKIHPDRICITCADDLSTVVFWEEAGWTHGSAYQPSSTEISEAHVTL